MWLTTKWERQQMKSAESTFMSTSRCGKICITLPKYSRKERRRNFYFCCSIEDAVLHYESGNTLFGLPKKDTTRNQWLRCIYNTFPEQFNPNI